MPTITVKDLPRKLHRALKSRAQAHHRSLNREVIATLHEATFLTRAADIEALTRDVREARGKFKRTLRAGDITAWKTKGRL